MPRDLFQMTDGIPDPNATGQNAYNSTAGAQPPPPPVVPKMVAPPQPDIPPPPPAPPLPPPMKPSNEEPGGRDLFAPSSGATTAYGAANRGGPDAGQKILDAEKADSALGSANMKAVSEAAGGPVDAEHGIDTFSRAADLAFSANSEERVKKLQAAGMEAKVIQPSNMREPMVVWRAPGENVWHPIRGTALSMGDVGNATAALPAVATQVGVSLIPGVGEASPLARMVMQGVAGGAERLAEREGDRARGFNTDTAGGDIAEAGKTGAINSVAELFGSLLSKVGLGMKGEAKGLFKPTAEGQAATEAAGRLQQFDPDVKDLTMFQTGSPLMQAKGSQLASVSPYVKDKVLAPQYSSIADMFRKAMANLTTGKTAANPSGAPGIDTAELDQILSSMTGDATSNLTAAVGTPNTELSAGGRALQGGLSDTLRPALSEKVNTRYQDVLDPKYNGVFDLSGVNKTADEIAAGIPAQGRPVTNVEDVPVDNGYGLNDISAPSTKQVETTEIPKVQIGGAAPDVQHVIDQLRKLNPLLGTEETTNTAATAPLQSVRSQLGYSAGEYPVGGTPAQKAAYVQANKLLKPLDEAIANPVAGDEALRTKVAAAKNSATFKNKVLDSDVMQDIKNSTTPEDLMKYTAPGNFTSMQMLKRTMPKESFAAVQDAFKTQLVRQPDQIPSILKSYESDPRTLEMLLSKPEQKAFGDYSDMIGKVQKSLPAQMKAQTDMSARMGTMIDNGQGAEIADMIARSPGGVDGKVGSNIRAAYMQSVLDRAVDPKTGNINPERMIKVLGDIIESGQAKGILKPAEMQRFMDARTYMNAADIGSDTQASLHKGSLASGAWNLIRPVQMAKTWGEVGLHAFQARLMTSPGASKFWIGAGQPAMATPRVMTNAMGALLNEMRTEEPKPQPDDKE